MRIHTEHEAQGTVQRRPAENAEPGGGGADTRACVPRRLPAFANLQEALLENMIQNILVEASRGEVVLTSRPRVITLPPLSFPRWERSGLPPRGQRRKGAAGGRGGLTWPEASPSPLPGICIFQDCRSGLAADGVLRATANRDVPAGGAAPYRLFADASAQPLRLPSLGSAGPPLHRPTSKASRRFFYICLDFISPTREQFARAEGDRWWERPRWTDGQRFIGDLGG